MPTVWLCVLRSCEPEAAQAMRNAGLAVMQANQGALVRLLAGLGRLLEGKSQ